MQIKTDFYNNAQSDLDAKYFPKLNSYWNDENCHKVHYQTELFSNGCLDYNTYILNVAKLCKAKTFEIKEVVNKYINF